LPGADTATAPKVAADRAGPSLVEELAQDLASAKVRGVINAEIRAQLLPILKQLGVDLPKLPHPGSPPTQQRHNHLHVVKPDDSPK
jgi:hypothetical protein